MLPGDIRDALWLVLALEAPAVAAKRPVEEVLAELLCTRRTAPTVPRRDTRRDTPMTVD